MEHPIFIAIFCVFILILSRISLIERLFGLTRFLRTRISVALLFLAVFSLLVTAFFSCCILLKFPNSGDEYAYIFQAKTFNEGRLWNQTYPFQKFFSFFHIADQGDKWVSKFSPGWPALLAVGLLLKIPLWLVNPLLGALSLVVFFFLANHLYGKEVAILSVLTMLCSAYFIFNSASYFSHTSCLLFILLFVYFARLYVDEGKLYQALMAGVFIGCAFTVRPYTALLCSIPFGIYFLFGVAKSRYIGMPLICFGAFPFAVALLIYNHQITGNALLPPHIWYEPNDTLGFVNGHNLTKGLALLGQQSFSLMGWSSPALLILYALLLVSTLVKGQRLKFEDCIFPSLVIGYVFYWADGGNQYGPRYYYEAYPFLILTVISKIFNQESFKSFSWQKLAISTVLSGFIIALLQIPMHAKVEHEAIVERMDVYHQVEKQHITNAIIFLGSATGVLRPMGGGDLARNGINFEADVLYALDRGTKNSELKKYFPDKTFYIYSRPKNLKQGGLKPLKPEG